MNSNIQEQWEKKPQGIQSVIMIVLSAISISIVLILCLVMYLRFSYVSRVEMTQSTQKLMEQSVEKMEDYLVSMRQISDTAYYNVIKERDLYKEKDIIQNGMSMLYEANKDYLRSIAIYNKSGKLLSSEPMEFQKENTDVTQQDWFNQAMGKMENMHFSSPHIQNLFDDGTYRYYTVISLSRVVELTERGSTELGVLLVDMDYAGISRMMKQLNVSGNGTYFYLCDSEGDIIYHPKQVQVKDGIIKENNIKAAKCKDGTYDVNFEGKNRKEIINTIGYTGWRMVGVIPNDTFINGMINIRYFIVLIISLMAMMLVVINHIVSVRISSPILKLNDSVKDYEAGKKPEIYIGGSTEVEHLGYSIQKSYEQIGMLMEEIVKDQNEKRKSELDALQSQINPHFLYNTLDSITWMIEGEKNDEAVFMISQLARLFRISLSQGHTIINIKAELQHAKSYMNIQKVRYKDLFSIQYDIDPILESYCTVKLVLQPILENAINYGIASMEDCGEIKITGKMENGNIVLSVSDNGLGMSKEEVDLILTDSNRVHKKGSGVGLVNVNNRLQLIFGKEYGVRVQSEPDEWTIVSIHIPAVRYTENNIKILENGHVFNRDELIDQ